MLLLLLLLPYHTTSLPTYPSCLSPNMTWSSSIITSITPGVASPELCQQLCRDEAACTAFTWLSLLTTMILLLLLLPYHTTSLPTYPSCLSPNMTWSSSIITSITPGIASPELCQQLCRDEAACTAVTWVTQEAEFYLLTCFAFSASSSPTEACDHCVSGAPTCSCSVEGECRVLEGNFLQALGGVATEAGCSGECRIESLCGNYTYLAEDNNLQ